MKKRSTIIMVMLCGAAMAAFVGRCEARKSGPYELVNAFPALRFVDPVFLTHSGDRSDRIFVLEQEGIIKAFPNDAHAVAAPVFLDIRRRVTAGGEMGLLGLAFHPQYARNGYFYVNYTTDKDGPRRTVIARFSTRRGDPDVGDAASERIILTFNQPYSNHNGGMVQFGPDNYLYIATGDGGSGGDPHDNGQNRSTLLGKILRIDVDGASGARAYRIPPDNPFAGNTRGFRDEIFAYGLRNPWRFSIDFPTGRIWAGDVGQYAREEVDLIVKGGNYGWRIMEGNLCYKPRSGCSRAGLIPPIKDYGRREGISVTGGYVYRGSLRPELAGAYIYGDYGSGTIWSLRYEKGSVTSNNVLLSAGFSISSFGVDEKNELYVLEYSGRGAVHRFAARK